MTAKIEIIEADITTLDVDAIVNAANEQLLRGGGVCGAIHAAAGPGLEQECLAIGGCPTGQARITAGHALASRHVIHAVGPVWQGGGQSEAALLAGCYRHCYQLADQAGLSSIALHIHGHFRLPPGSRNGNRACRGKGLSNQARQSGTHHILLFRRGCDRGLSPP